MRKPPGNKLQCYVAGLKLRVCHFTQEQQKSKCTKLCALLSPITSTKSQPQADPASQILLPLIPETVPQPLRNSFPSLLRKFTHDLSAILIIFLFSLYQIPWLFINLIISVLVVVFLHYAKIKDKEIYRSEHAMYTP